MEKDLLDEIMEALQRLKDEQKNVTIHKPIPPHMVFSTIGQVIKKHKLTLDERKAFITTVAMMDEVISPVEMTELRELDRLEDSSRNQARK